MDFKAYIARIEKKLSYIRFCLKDLLYKSSAKFKLRLFRTFAEPYWNTLAAFEYGMECKTVKFISEKRRKWARIFLGLGHNVKSDYIEYIIGEWRLKAELKMPKIAGKIFYRLGIVLKDWFQAIIKRNIKKKNEIMRLNALDKELEIKKCTGLLKSTG